MVRQAPGTKARLSVPQGTIARLEQGRICTGEFLLQDGRYGTRDASGQAVVDAHLPPQEHAQ